MNPAFWSGKRVFVTGHTGFKGGWLSLWLQSLGAKVAGYALEPPTSPSLYAEARVQDGMHVAIADIRDREALKCEMTAFSPDIVFHLAAQPLVRRSYADPVLTYETNILGVANLLEAVRLTESVRCVVNVTTDKCYENREWHWGYRESEALGGHDPYSSSKACAEIVTAAYRASFFAGSVVQIATARAGNVIGGGDWAEDRLVPDLLRSFDRNEVLQVRHPFAVRPWQHVLEPLSGYLSLAEKLWTDGAAFAEAWNFGPRDEDCRPVQFLVEELGKRMGVRSLHAEAGVPGVHEATFLKLDISKALYRLDWAPIWSLPAALAKVAEWHNDWRSGRNMRDVCLRQIAQYMNSEGDCADGR